MQIKKLKISNFRGIKEPQEIFFQDFNLIVGKNDAGKSTILKALDLFLNDKAFNIVDKNINADSTEVSIELLFSVENDSIIIDDNIPTSFREEGLLNQDNLLHIKKVWNVGSSLKVPAPKVSILRKMYSENDFLVSTEKELLTLCSKYKISTRKGNDSQYNNVEKRAKLREFYENNNIQYDFREDIFPTSGTSRLKKIADVIKSIVPIFEYFKADASLSETDTDIQNFFKSIATKAINEEINTNDVEEGVSQKLQEILAKITAKINSVVGVDEKVEAEVSFDWSKLIKTTFRSHNENNNIERIPLSSRGDGFRRITMMAYFEYLAEENNSKQNIVFGFEEPETFLHPSAQEKLFEKLSALSENGYQVVISSHSSIIVAKSQLDKIIHIIKNNGTIEISQNLTNAKFVVEDLGISADNQFISLLDNAKVLFLVEGPTDVQAIKHICDVYKKEGEITHTFDELGCIYLPVGGCGSVKHWKNLDLFTQFNKPYFIYLDSDKTSSSDNSKTRYLLIKYGFSEGKDFHVTKKRELENYISCSALNRLFPNANLAYSDWDDIKKICKNHADGFNIGGDKVAEKRFSQLTYFEIKSTYYDGNEDEFLKIYNIIKGKIQNKTNA